MFNVVDLVFIVIILIFALIATAKGFVKAIFGKLCWILGLIIAFLFFKTLSEPLKNYVKSEIGAQVVAFILIFVVVFIIVKVIQIIISKIFEGEILKGLDKSLGFFFGLIEGLAIVFAIIFVAETFFGKIFDTAKIFEGSFFYNLLSRFIPQANNLITKETA